MLTFLSAWQILQMKCCEVYRICCRCKSLSLIYMYIKSASLITYWFVGKQMRYNNRKLVISRYIHKIKKKERYMHKISNRKNLYKIMKTNAVESILSGYRNRYDYCQILFSISLLLKIKLFASTQAMIDSPTNYACSFDE